MNYISFAYVSLATGVHRFIKFVILLFARSISLGVQRSPVRTSKKTPALIRSSTTSKYPLFVATVKRV